MLTRWKSISCNIMIFIFKSYSYLSTHDICILTVSKNIYAHPVASCQLLWACICFSIQKRETFYFSFLHSMTADCCWLRNEKRVSRFFFPFVFLQWKHMYMALYKHNGQRSEGMFTYNFFYFFAYFSSLDLHNNKLTLLGRNR